MCVWSKSVLTEDREACLMLEVYGNHVPGQLDLLNPMKKGAAWIVCEQSQGCRTTCPRLSPVIARIVLDPEFELVFMFRMAAL